MSTSHTKGQIAAEFLIIFSVLLILFITILVLYRSQRVDIMLEQEQYAAQRIGGEIADTFVMLASLSENQSVSYYLPSTLRGKDYTLYLDNSSHSILIQSNNLLTGVGISYSAFASTNLTPGTNYVFTNLAGVITIE